MNTVSPLQPEDIAHFTDEQLGRLNFEEMIEVIFVSKMTVRNVESIHECEGDTIFRLAYRARDICRKSANGLSTSTFP